MNVDNQNMLKALYGTPSFRAKHKVQKQLDKHSSRFIQTSPFVVVSTTSKDYKMDASPRGGNPGFVTIIDSKTIIIPDAKGNNRIDSLKNIVETGQIGLLFLIPGVDETLRINGKAQLATDESYLKLFSEEQNPPKLCILVEIEEAFLHCAKALMRSKLWNEDTKIERSEFPTMGEMLKDQLNSSDVPETQEDMIKRYTKDL